jgi:tartrate dehydratase alpha subunit/fumarate hydratase class I-like protein
LIREIDFKTISEKIKEAFISANMILPESLVKCIKNSIKSETFPLAESVLV